MNAVEKIRLLEALYARIPKMKDCKGKCADSCTVIPITAFEKRRIESAMGQEFKTLGCAQGGFKCSALTKDGKCSQYDLRPLICRAFGAVDHPFLRCEHGCEPERWLPNPEFIQMMGEYEALFGHAWHDEPAGYPKLTDEQARAAVDEFLK